MKTVQRVLSAKAQVVTDGPSPPKKQRTVIAAIQEIDDNFEFNAPKFFDFNSNEDSENKRQSNWFDKDHSNTPSDNIFALSKEIVNAASKPVLKQQKKKVEPTRTRGSGLRYLPTRSVKPLTVPKEFNLSSKSTSVAGKSKIAPKKLSKQQTIKKIVSKVKASTTEITIPKPFNFSSSVKHLVNDVTAPKSPFKSLASRVKEYENTIPDRFKPGKKKIAIVKKRNYNEPELTNPKSPMLQTRLRSKKTTIPTAEEREINELKKKKPFKANPVNKKILQQTDRPFGVPPRLQHDLTIAHSPAIIKPKPLDPPIFEKPIQFKATPILQVDEPFAPILEHRHTETVIVELPGDKISEKKLLKLREELTRKDEEERMMKSFVANPIRGGSPDIFPPKEVFVTEPAPFHLETEERGAILQKKIAEKIGIENAELEKARNFHANPLPADTPFFPEKSTKKPTAPENIVLHSVIRAKERKEFDEELKRREDEDAHLLKMKGEEDLEEEKEKIKALRNQAVHKAQPVKRFAKTKIQPSTKKLTEAHSPMIGEKRKRVARNLQTGSSLKF